MSGITARYEDLTGRVQKVQFLTRTVQVTLTEQARALAAYQSNRDRLYEEEFLAAADQLNATLMQMESTMQVAEGKAILARIMENSQIYRSRAVSLFDGKVVDRAVFEVLRDELMSDADALISMGDGLAEQVRQQAADSSARARWVIAAVSLVAVAGGLAIGLILSGQILRPVSAIARMASRVAEGDLTVEPLAVRNRDELGEMAAAFNQMLASMRTLLQGVSTSSEALMGSSEQLSAAADASATASGGAAQAIAQVSMGASEQAGATHEVNATMGQLKDAIQQIAAGATRSAGEVQKASVLLHEMVSHLDEVVADAAATADRAAQAVTRAAGGADVVTRSLREIESIGEAAEQTTECMSRLERHSGQIGAITEVIANIADQTNLLALNAAIEAARAGEHGRGFAVVAEEVRKLAEQSAASTREITELVRQIQAATAEAARATELGTERAKSGNRLAAQAGESLTDIMGTLQRAAESISNIARSAEQVRMDSANVLQVFNDVAALTEENTAAAEEMAAGATEVTEAVERITQIAQGNAAAAEEVSASVEELTASSEQVAATAQDLLATAQELQAQVHRFRL